MNSLFKGKMKKPNIFISWLIGLALPILLFGGLYLSAYVSNSIIKLIIILGTLIVTGGILFGEIIHIHKILNLYNKKLEALMQKLKEFDEEDNEQR